MWNINNINEDETKPTKASTERTVVGIIYLMLAGALLSGLLHLIA